MLGWAVSLAALALLSGCGRQEIQVYAAPKDKAAPQAKAMAHNHADDPHGAMQSDPHGAMSSGGMELTFKLPDGWKEKPAGQMRAAQFAVPGKDGLDADVSVIPLAGMTASREDILNIWREQLKLPAVEKGSSDQQVESVVIAGQKADLYDMVSNDLLVQDKAKMRILTAVLVRDQTSWFVKMSGPDDLVKQSKPAFQEFLKTISFGAAAAPQAHTADAHSASADPSQPKLQAPAHWQVVTPGPMLKFKYLVSEAGGKQAEVTISSLGGDGGGTLPNLNRWRGQLMLQPVGQDELAKLGSPLQIGGAQVIAYDMKGTSAKDGNAARMVVLSVPVGGQSWFYKLLGDEAVVEKEKENFLKFVQSAH